jgi:hypothetical protein
MRASFCQTAPKGHRPRKATSEKSYPSVAWSTASAERAAQKTTISRDGSAINYRLKLQTGNLTIQTARASDGTAEQRSPVRFFGQSVRESDAGVGPSLRAFAISLCGNVEHGNDLVQETLLHAAANMEFFQHGTNMSAWLFTIMRDLFRSEYRK